MTATETYAYDLTHRIILLLFVLVLSFCLCANAQEEEPSPAPSASPVPGKKTTGVKLQFLPPPMEGAFSLGIYDKSGKLVRTLHREAKMDEFGIALNGLITHWDGKDDSGAQMPAGKYFARGFCVGDEVKTKRENFSLNDSASNEKSVPSPKPVPADSMASATPNEEQPASGAATSPSQPVDSPKPAGIAPPAASDTFDAVKNKLKMPDGRPFTPEEKIKLKLVANPLNQDKPGSAEVAAGIDEKGSFLKTADGLFLKRVSDTPHLKWAVIARSAAQPSLLVLFQSDGAIVEEITISKLANMMAFDCGDFDYDPARVK